MASAIPTKKAFKSGEVIMRQGDPGESAYIIESGLELLLGLDVNYFISHFVAKIYGEKKVYYMCIIFFCFF